MWLGLVWTYGFLAFDMWLLLSGSTDLYFLLITIVQSFITGMLTAFAITSRR